MVSDLRIMSRRRFSYVTWPHHYTFKDVPAGGGCAVVRLKLTPLRIGKDPSLEDNAIFDNAIEERRQEADEFYGPLALGPISNDLRQIMRQAFGGMLWTKQYYRFVQREWIEGEPVGFLRNGDIYILRISFLCPTSRFYPGDAYITIANPSVQMGVSIFRRMGHCFPLYPVGGC